MGARPRATVDRAFGHFAWSQSASQMAARVGEAAMPLIALAMHIPNAQIGLISFAQFLPVMLFTLLFGAWIDGTSKSTPMLVGHAGRAMVFGILGWLAAIDQLGLPVLLAGVFVAGTFTAAFDVAVQGIVPQLVAPSRLIAANGRVQLTYSVAQVVGPSLAGFLVGLSQPFVALLVIAATYAIACAVFAPARAASPRPERTGGSRPNVFGRLWEGIRFSFSDRVLVRLLAAGTAFNLLEQALITTFLVYGNRELNLSASMLGLLLASSGAGAVLAAAIMRGRGPRRPTATMLGWMGAATLAPLLLITVSGHSVTSGSTIVVVFFTYGAGLVVYNVIAVSVRQHRASADMRSRVGAVYRFFAYGALGFGGLLSSALIATCGPRWALITIVLAMAAGTIIYATQLWSVRKDLDKTLNHIGPQLP
ncbi:MFS transporter [Curtobacterium poinsettiae]|uniref:MFS transporter n=1 Tax=Curtobacterium poinsettiae TaxID=159612 RepID=UPI0021C67F6A|nr:MFS transporter [Curtobacterium flaccumfaciens]MCU0115970.1 MFS transporter [Curtobacterium flaccumfaciens]